MENTCGDVYNQVDSDPRPSWEYYPPGWQEPVKETITKPGYIPHVLLTPKNSYNDWEVGDFITKRGLNFYEGNIIKYIDRHRRKNGKEDLLKARTYLDQLIKEYD